MNRRAIGKNVSCGKCGGDSFTASISPSPEEVVITFVCTSCGHNNRAGVKRTVAAKGEEEEEKKGFLQRLRESLFSRKKEEEVDWETDIGGLMEEGSSNLP